MMKRDLVIRISNDTGMIQQDVLAVVQHMLDVMAESLAHGKTIELRQPVIGDDDVRRTLLQLAQEVRPRLDAFRPKAQAAFAELVVDQHDVGRHVFDHQDFQFFLHVRAGKSTHAPSKG